MIHRPLFVHNRVNSISLGTKVSIGTFILLIILVTEVNAQWANLGNIIPQAYNSKEIQIAPDGTIWEASGRNSVVSRNSPVVSRSTDGGISWSSSTISAVVNQWPWGISPIDSLTAWVTCIDDGLFKTVDGGQNWVKSTNYPYEAIDVHFFDSTNGWVFGFDPNQLIIYQSVTSDGGATWLHIGDVGPTPPGTSTPPAISGETFGYTNFTTASFSNVTGDNIVIGTSLGYWISSDRGYNWVRVSTPLANDNVIPMSVAVKNVDTVLIVTDENTNNSFIQQPFCYSTFDGGQTWNRNTLPVSVSCIEYIPGTLGTFVCIGIFDYAGGSSGTAVTPDAGNNWYLTDTTSLNTIDFLNDSVGYAGGYDGIFNTIIKGRPVRSRNAVGQILKWTGPCFITSSTEKITACNSYFWPVNGQTYTTTGNYVDTLKSSFGCDSIVTLELEVESVSLNLSVLQNGLTLLALENTPGSTLQWLSCGDDFSPIIGEINNTFTVTESGSYAVEISNGICIDSSNCITICLGVEDTIQTKMDSLIVEGKSGTFQWIDCNNAGSSIAGAVDSFYVPTSSGSYSVVLLGAVCNDTLPCVNYIATNADQDTKRTIEIYPNPFTNTISMVGNIPNKSLYELFSSSGQKVLEGEIKGTVLTTAKLPAGIYLIRLTDDSGNVLYKEKLIKY